MGNVARRRRHERRNTLRSRASQTPVSPGSAHSRQPISITLGLPSRGLVSIQWSLALLGAILPNALAHIRISAPVGLRVDAARNTIVADALKTDARGKASSHLLFLDDDTLIPRDGIARLIAHDLPIVSALVYTRGFVSRPAFTPEKGMLVRQDWVPGDLIACYGVGAACLLIKVEVLRRMLEELPLEIEGGLPKWFSCVSDLLLAGEEDFFCENAAKPGYQPVVDTGVFCWHWDNNERCAYPLDKWREFQERGTITWPTRNGPILWAGWGLNSMVDYSENVHERSAAR